MVIIKNDLIAMNWLGWIARKYENNTNNPPI